MACYNPIAAFQCGDGEIVFNEQEALRYATRSNINLPCGKCIGCTLNYSRHWATRIMHEAQMHTYNSVVTLTYDDDHLPSDRSLHHDHFQLFIRRLKKRLSKEVRIDGQPQRSCASGILHSRHEQRAVVRYYVAGEYGESYKRPHYHAILFGIDFQNKLIFKDKLWRSPELEQLWPHGYSSIMPLTWQTAAYVARYVIKKQESKTKTRYQVIDPDTGELITRKSEYTKMSRRPGIGANWLDKYQSDVYPRGKVIVNGTAVNPPRYYDNKFKERDPEAFEQMKAEREIEQQKYEHDDTPARRRVKEQVAKARAGQLKRQLT